MVINKHVSSIDCLLAASLPSHLLVGSMQGPFGPALTAARPCARLLPVPSSSATLYHGSVDGAQRQPCVCSRPSHRGPVLIATCQRPSYRGSGAGLRAGGCAGGGAGGCAGGCLRHRCPVCWCGHLTRRGGMARALPVPCLTVTRNVVSTAKITAWGNSMGTEPCNYSAL